MLREPLARTISDYKQSMRTVDMGSETDFFKNSKLGELISNSNTNWRFTNNQAKQIAVDVDPNKILTSKDKNMIDQFSRFLISEYKNLQYSDDELFEICKKRLEEFAFVGITERFEESMQLLCYTFRWKPLKVNPFLNKSPDDNFETSLTSNTINDIKKCNAVDQKIYSLANKNFENKFSQMIIDLMQSYYDSSLSSLSFKDLLYLLIEKHYEKNFWKNTPKIDSLDYDFSQSLIGDGWHSRELGKNKKIFRWTGPSPVSTIDLPLFMPTEKTIKIVLYDYADIEIVKNLEFYINNFKILLKFEKVEDKRIIYRGTAKAECFITPNNFTRLKFILNKTIDLKDLDLPNSESRKIGIAVENISLN